MGGFSPIFPRLKNSQICLVTNILSHQPYRFAFKVTFLSILVSSHISFPQFVFQNNIIYAQTLKFNVKNYQNSQDLERVQKSALKIILQEND